MEWSVPFTDDEWRKEYRQAQEKESSIAHAYRAALHSAMSSISDDSAVVRRHLSAALALKSKYDTALAETQRIYYALLQCNIQPK